MALNSYERINKSQEYLSSLGAIHHRALFGGYSLSVDNTVFAMVAEGELYLRACEDTAPYMAERQMPQLAMKKRGRQVSLQYYQVDDTLWKNRPKLLELCSQALSSARREKQQQIWQRRMKDLPNLTLSLEVLLLEAGIANEHMLRRLGARQSWLKLRAIRKSISIKVLYALEGAISGMHEAALPAETRRALCEWAQAFEPSRFITPDSD